MHVPSVTSMEMGGVVPGRGVMGSYITWWLVNHRMRADPKAAEETGTWALPGLVRQSLLVPKHVEEVTGWQVPLTRGASLIL